VGANLDLGSLLRAHSPQGLQMLPGPGLPLGLDGALLSPKK
jgi:hypothetical protein